MNQVQLIQLLLSRNIPQDLNALNAVFLELSDGLTQDQRDFMKTSWREIGPFFKSEQGKSAIGELVDKLMDFSTKPLSK